MNFLKKAWRGLVEECKAERTFQAECDVAEQQYFSKAQLDRAKEPPKLCPVFKHSRTSDESQGAYLEYQGLKVIVDVYKDGTVVLLTQLNDKMIIDEIDYLKQPTSE